MVFSNEEASAGEWNVWEHGNLKTIDHVPIEVQVTGMGDLSKPGVTTNSFLNTKVFLKAWDLLIKDGRFWEHDWVVKVDPDAVFFPDRLQDRLKPLTSYGLSEGNAMYIVNCDRQFGAQDTMPAKLFGSLEVFSRNAINAYAHGGAQRCQQMDWKGWGEDYFMQMCMDLLGVEQHADFKMIGDDRCHAASCFDQERVAFHDFKDAAGYFKCWYEAMGPQGAEDHLAQVRADRLARQERVGEVEVLPSASAS